MTNRHLPAADGARGPVVGLTCFDIEARLGLSQTYIQAVARAGAAPLLLPHLADLRLVRAAYERCDGLLLSGGEDVDPAYYGEAIHDKCGRISALRDGTELALARWAAGEGKPLLAICRGIQVLNVALGGSLYQDIASQCPSAAKHDWYPGFARDRLSHPVYIEPETSLARIVGAALLPVNSLHHQAIKEVAPPLVITAQAPDGIVEAVEIRGHPFAIGVQWHPEELAPADAAAERLFEALAAACRR